MSKSNVIPPDVYPVLRYGDGRSAIDWLIRAFGFKSHFETASTDGGVGHAELAFGRGMLMLAGSRRPDPTNPWSTERDGVYIAVNDIDAHYAQAMAAGAEIVMPLADTDYGLHQYSVRDPEGHLWSIGNYRP